MNSERFQKMLEEKGISLSPQQLHQFDTYFKTLVEWNGKMNLTAITNEEDVYLKHFYDSISAAFYFDFTRINNICDVGAGAGFPSIPLKICFPHLDLAIVDSLKKRITFLEHLSQEIGLKDAHFYHDRAETFSRKKEHREQYALVTARAVARMSVLTELCMPLVRQDGTFLAMKAASAKDELEDAKRAIGQLGGELDKVEKFSLPIENSERNLIFVRKQKSTPKKFPRKPGTPNRNPL
ncbi:16S rRNA (guanine(527)-N(7))-methyltransferase RsmG [Pseudalkalibacillus salsuginis]|uniref:16S rRNA (guanine(527)-N(7))-methyltransferase RsmG n=1 Tax=Pseudalkalibacillus salsuginis TaxID=2910972 RepID=UPI001F324148|nr:16S rRNA (guanine(527)-N(7))-methyltransferase RsmG [Pseudalkalibacillus salsuginis]MCF6410715.1 16S rRNA (guanine(527)-N(7))-methyltransferase RsmG [Pseudalkalibacillus salsuginis]